MSIFNFFKLARQQPPPPNPTDPGYVNPGLLKSKAYRQLDKAYMSSIRLKDQVLLDSALRMRQQATEAVRDIPVLYSLGKHHEMILEYNHMGHGVEARRSALECLKYEEEFIGISKVLCSKFAYEYYTETMNFAAVTSGSFDESLQYLIRLKTHFPNEANQEKYDRIVELRTKFGRWYTAQRMILATFYSRVSADQDNGKYAAGLSIIDVILSNSEKTGYQLSYEEYVDLIDDMCAISLKYFKQKIQNCPKGQSRNEDAVELGCILKKSIIYLSNFIPDCLPKDIPLFEKYCADYASIPWINHLPEWQKLKLIMKS